MAKDIKALRKRIKSFDSTLHLTGAMGLVASSKMRKATDAMLQGRKYLKAVSEIVDDLTRSQECLKSVFFSEEPELKITDSTRLIVIAGDRGLCGGYNANVFRMVRDLGVKDIVPIGKRAFDRYTDDELSDFDPDYVRAFDSSEHYSFDSAMETGKSCINDFREGRIDRVGIVYNKYVSILTQEPHVKWILPLTRLEGRSANAGIYEPEPLVLLEDILPQYFAGVLYSLVKESFACEVASRRMAMDSATKNATEMIDNLTLEYNRVRQSKITQEITEIVAGAGSK
ncbi:MAG: ATP synthase F1 subunit gamma [Clostridiales bacterium]|nr:ATP synthase F1 subunit gamma [Clostridiales bacterium]